MTLVIFGSSHVKTLQQAVGRVFKDAAGVVCHAKDIPVDTTYLSVGGMTLEDFNRGSGKCYTVKRSLMQCGAKTVILIAGANDLDGNKNVSVENVLHRFTETVNWLCRYFESVIVVRLFHREFPRPFNRNWHYKFPGRFDYNYLSAQVNDGLVSLAQRSSGQVRICRQIDLANAHLTDGVHLTDAGCRKLFMVLSRALKM